MHAGKREKQVAGSFQLLDLRCGPEGDEGGSHVSKVPWAWASADWRFLRPHAELGSVYVPPFGGLEKLDSFLFKVSLLFAVTEWE